MSIAFYNLLKYTASQASGDLVRAYCPVDPGYHHYVEQLEAVRKSIVVPYPTDFDLNEPINLTSWGNPDDYDFPDEFRAFRRFTSSIVLHPMDQDAQSGVQPLCRFHGCHSLAHDLLVDTSINNPEHFSFVQTAIAAARDVLVAPIQDVLPDFQYVDDHCVCFSFGMLYLAQCEENWDASERMADQLLLDLHEGDLSNGLVVELPTERLFWNENVKRNWRQMIDTLSNPTDHHSTSTIISLLKLQETAD